MGFFFHTYHSFTCTVGSNFSQKLFLLYVWVLHYTTKLKFRKVCIHLSQSTASTSSSDNAGFQCEWIIHTHTHTHSSETKRCKFNSFLDQRNLKLTYPTSQKTVQATNIDYSADQYLQHLCREIKILDCIPCSSIANDSRPGLRAGTKSLHFSCYTNDVISCFLSGPTKLLGQQMDTSPTEVSAVYGILVL